MAASLEYQVISKVVEQQDFHTIEKLRVTDEFFFAPEVKQIFQFIRDHFRAPQTFGSVPSLQLIQSIFHGFQFTPSNDTIETLCDQLRLFKLRSEIQIAADDMLKIAESNPRAALDICRETAADLSSRHEFTSDLMMHNMYDELLSDYELVAEGRGVTGLPWPWEPLNEATQGIHPGEFIVVYGRPKNMKTWVALYVMTILNLHFNARVLVCSMEMPTKQMARRMAAIRAVVDYKKLLAGKLQPVERDRFFYRLWELKEQFMNPQLHVNGPRFAECMITGGKKGGMGISYLHSKIREFRPDIVLVDGMYLMKDERQGKRTVDWKAIAHISQDLKSTARDFNIPIVATAQANRTATKDVKNADVSEMAYSDAIGQDTDFSIRVHKRIDKSTGEPELAFGFPGSRETDLDSFLIHAIPAVNFGLKSTVVVTENDDKDGEGRRSNGAPVANKPMPTIGVGRIRNEA